MPAGRKRNARSTLPTIFCEVCSIELNCDAQAQQHINGKSHLKKLRVRQGGGKGLQTPLVNPDGVRAPDFMTKGSTAPQTSTDKDVPPTPEGESDPVGSAVMANMMGKLPKKRKVVEIPCAVCAMVFNCEQTAVDHYASDKHARKLKVVQQYSGTVIENPCNLPTIAKSPDVDKSIPDTVKEESVSASVEGNAGVGGTFYCNFCSISCNSMQVLEAHKKGAKHRKNVTKKSDAAAASTTPNMTKGPVTSWGQLKASGGSSVASAAGTGASSFQCRACKIFFSGPADLHKHLGSKEHNAKLDEITAAESTKP